MKCPYCSKEMECGYLYNGYQPVQWIPNDKKPSNFAFRATDDGVKLNNEFTMRGYRAEAYYCKTCHIVISKPE
ncbi:MAG: MarR family transcriptional regulator [Ruminococcaceae bacterium]|nr:MarR family transcriptional regulator [Oscillospiraceae bacterium]